MPLAALFAGIQAEFTRLVLRALSIPGFVALHHTSCTISLFLRLVPRMLQLQDENLVLVITSFCGTSWVLATIP